MTRLTDHARAARNEATAAQLRGGTLHVYGGIPPSKDDEPAGERPLIVKVAIPDSRIAVRGDRAGVLARGLAKAIVEAEGEPTWWRAISRDGKTTVLAGEVLTGEAADAAFAKAASGEVPAGIAIDQKKLWRGMELELEELRFDIRGGKD